MDPAYVGVGLVAFLIAILLWQARQSGKRDERDKARNAENEAMEAKTDALETTLGRSDDAVTDELRKRANARDLSS